MSREHTVRAAGADRGLQKFVLGKFPGAVPDLRAPGPWRLARQEEGSAKDWSLESDQGGTKFRGVPDGGIAGATPSNYFILIKQRGSDDFRAIPVDEWATFKSVYQRAELSLEDAEAQMKYRRLQAERANPRLAQAIGTEDAETATAATAAATQGGDEDADSDEEWKDIKARAASLASGPNAGNTNNVRKGAKPTTEEYDGATQPELAMDGAVYVPKPRDAEDWEHESEAADDDLDMGGGSESEVEVSPTRAPALSDSDGEGDMDASKVKRAIRRMMRETGLQESEGSEASGDEEEEEDAEDEEDLDRMASEMLPAGAVPGGAGEKEKAPTAVAGAGAGGGRKRKTPPPGAGVVGPSTATGAEGGGVLQSGGLAREAEGAAKKARTTAAAAVPAAGGGGTGTGPPREAEIVALLRSRGKMLLKDISAAFSGRLAGAEERKNFSAIVRRVAKLAPPDEQGRKFLILR